MIRISALVVVVVVTEGGPQPNTRNPGPTTQFEDLYRTSFRSSGANGWNNIRYQWWCVTTIGSRIARVGAMIVTTNDVGVQ